MDIRLLKRDELNSALKLVWDVFCKYEAVNYPENSKNAFRQAIHSDEYLEMLTAYGAFDGDRIVGIIATRGEGTHVALFFVDGSYHRQGVGRRLWNVMLKDNESKIITVHSSLYAVPVYERLGFVKTDDVQKEDGITFVPMAFERG